MVAPIASTIFGCRKEDTTMTKLIRIAAVATFAVMCLAIAGAQTKATKTAPITKPSVPAVAKATAKAQPKAPTGLMAKAAASSKAVLKSSSGNSKEKKTSNHHKRSTHHKLRTRHGSSHAKSLSTKTVAVKAKAMPAPKTVATPKTSSKPKATSNHGKVQRK